MNTFIGGVVAELIATVVPSILMIFRGTMDVMPDSSLIAVLAASIGPGAAMGWVACFSIGIGCGFIFSAPSAHRSPVQGMPHDIALGALGWMGMPSDMRPVRVATLMLHAIFGAGLGATCHVPAKGPART